MKRSISIVLTALLLGLVPAAEAEAKTFKTCTELRKTYKHGVSLSRASVNKGIGPIFSPRVSASIFRLNARLDIDRDGIACEVVRKIAPRPPAPVALPTIPSDTNAALLSSVELCKVEQGSRTNEILRTGFPRSDDLAIKNGKIVVQLIYVDFTDLTDSSLPSADIDFWRVGVNRFFDAMSEKSVRFEWRYENRYLRMPRPISEYRITRESSAGTQGDFSRFVQDAVTAADPSVDFTDVDFVVAVMPPNVSRSQADVSPALVLSKRHPFKTQEGNVFRGTMAAADTRMNEGYLLIVHEFGHLLGLQDYYSLSYNQSMPFSEQFKYMGQFDNMNFAPGDSREWVAWNRWILSFLPDSRVRCLGGNAPAETTHLLSAASVETTNSQLVIVPTSRTSAIAIESRRNVRFDSRAREISNGLLVYKINTENPSGFGPITVVRKPNTVDAFLADAPLRQGESVTIDGVTITNQQSSKDWDLAKVVISGR